MFNSLLGVFAVISLSLTAFLIGVQVKDSFTSRTKIGKRTCAHCHKVFKKGQKICTCTLLTK
jgi:hypothetical protein